MADVKISALPSAASVALADLVPIVKGGVTSQATFTQVKAALAPTGTGIATVASGAFDAAVPSNVLAGSGYISLGATPATTGGLRLANNTFVYARNAENNANVEILGLTAGDVIELGANNGADIVIGAGLNQLVTLDADEVIATGTMQLGAATDVGGGVGVFGIDDAGTVPTTNPTAGIILYSDGGVGKVRQADGTVITIAAGGFTAPTGTGVMTTTSGAMDAAASIGTALQVLRTNAGATDVEWAAASGTPAGSDTYVQFNDSSAFGGDAGLTYNKTSDVLTVGATVAVGANPATAGTALRVGGTGAAATVYFRNNANSVDIKFFERSTTDVVKIGDASYSSQWDHYSALVNSATTFEINCASGYVMAFSTTAIESARAVIGQSAASSPFGVHGLGVEAMAGATVVLGAAVYCYYTVKVTGTGTNVIKFPAATNAAGYTKYVWNAGSGTLAVQDSNSVAAAATLAAGAGALFQFSASSVVQLTAAFTVA